MKRTTLLSILVALAILAGGCNPSSSTKSTGVDMLIGMDVTGSNNSKKDSYAGMAHAALDLLPSPIHVQIVTFGPSGTADLQYNADVSDPAIIVNTLKEYRLDTAPTKRKTYWRPMLERLETKLKQATRPVAVMIFSDGEIHDVRECVELINALADKTVTPQPIKGIYIGPTLVESPDGDRWKATIEKAFAPFGSRLYLCSANDQYEVLNKFLEDMQK